MNATERNLDALGRQAAGKAMIGAADWLRSRKIDTRALKDAQLDALCAKIRARIQKVLPEALADARRAFDAGMPGFAGPTFMASMSGAGISAAQEWAGAEGLVTA